MAQIGRYAARIQAARIQGERGEGLGVARPGWPDPRRVGGL